MSQLEALTNPQPAAGKKDITPHQKQMRTLIMSHVRGLRDESNKDEPVRLVVEPHSSKQTPEDLMALLLAHTSLECNVPVNMVMMGNDGNPNCKGLVEVLREWIAFRFICVERRLRTRLSNVQSRLHILAGRLLAFASLDAVIRVIRDAEEPKSELIKEFGFTEPQAEDILEIRLRQLARLEGFKIEAEVKALREEEADLQFKLSDRDAFTTLVLSEVEGDAAKYGDERRSLIEEAGPAKKAAAAPVASEPITLIVSRQGWIRSRQGYGVDTAGLLFKSGDSCLALIETKTDMTVLAFDSNGRVYTFKASDVPGGRGDGVPISTLVDLQKVEGVQPQIVHVISGAADTRYVFSCSGGYGFTAQISELAARNKAGKSFMTLISGESMLRPLKAASESVAVISSVEKGLRMLVFPTADIKHLPKGGRGVMFFKLADGERMTHIGAVGADGVLIGTSNGTEPLDHESTKKYLGKRAGRGASLKLMGEIVEIL
jgi:topoisomerase-4 subunit A